MGVKIIVDGWSGDNMRCQYSPNRHVWITKQELAMESISQVSLPFNNLSMHKNNTDTIAPGSGGTNY